MKKKTNIIKKENIWSETSYELLYTELINKFGTYDKWNGKTKPFKKFSHENKKYVEFLDLFAQTVGAGCGAAVDQQIKWSFHLSPINLKTFNYTTVFLKNIYWALKTGFITPENFNNNTKICWAKMFSEFLKFANTAQTFKA